MNDLREWIQYALKQANNIECGVPVADDVVENGKTYFGYELQEDYVGSDFNNNYSIRGTLIGRLVRKINDGEDTLLIIDNALKELKSKFKLLNMKYSYRDITLDEKYKKIQVTCTFFYNEINKGFIK